LSEITLRYIYTPKALLLRLEINRLAKDPAQIQENYYDRKALRFKPNSVGKIMHAEYNNIATHDKFGFRNPCFDFKRKGTHLLIGDSFLYGIGVSDLETIGCQLKMIDPKSNVYTLGIPGIGPENYLEMITQHINFINKIIDQHKKVSFLIFLGNDYEQLLNLKTNEARHLKKVKGGETSKQEKINIINELNLMLVKNQYLAKSYFLNGLKLIFLNLTKQKDFGSYIQNYAGSSFYKHGIKNNFDDLVVSIDFIDSFLSGLNLNLENLFLVPSPADLDLKRLKRDMLIAGMDWEKINTEFKFNNLHTACKKMNVNCVDLRTRLNQQDYYKQDNHFKSSGVKNIIPLIILAIK